MRKLFLVGFVWLCAPLLYADNLSSEKTQAWRSTETASALTDVGISTVATYVYKIVVTSGVALSEFQYFNSSGAYGSGVEVSSSVVYSLATTGSDFEVRDFLSRGFRYTKTGNASFRVLWDYLLNPPQGLGNTGIKR